VGHAAVEVGGVAEGEAGPFEALLRPLRPGLDRHAEFAQHVRTPAPARHRPVPVLDDRHPGGGRDEGGGGADVERPALVPAGPAGVQDRPADRDEADHLLAQHEGGGGDLGGRFALHAQGGEEGGGPGVVHPPGDEVADGLGHAAGRHVAAGEQGREHLGEPRRGRQLQGETPCGEGHRGAAAAARRLRYRKCDGRDEFSLSLCTDADYTFIHSGRV